MTAKMTREQALQTLRDGNQRFMERRFRDRERQPQATKPGRSVVSFEDDFESGF